MKIGDLIADIEGGSLRADLGLASTRKILLRRLETHPTIAAARQYLLENPSGGSRVLERAHEILAKPAPEGYAHPDDLILSAYLYILSEFSAPDSDRLITDVRDADRPEFYWSARLARYLAATGPVTRALQTASTSPTTG